MRETGFCVGKFGNGKGAGATSHFFRRDVLLLEFYNWGNGRKLVMLRRGDDEVMGMKVNRISFYRISVTFSGCAEPSEVFEIYIDDQKLSDFISWAGPVWRDDLYLNLMRSLFLERKLFWWRYVMNVAILDVMIRTSTVMRRRILSYGTILLI